ncbi:hypothetical protein FOZ76_23295 [Verticiella sediminum]|uniref:Peptidase inhibitor I78 family protein n=1 Tax=Verticiella sediminum TaxID=1247510 RepID=A0A556ACU2_9BURK|nr:I78 family peptidase inhibitor [Verticiella sediminum]TSH90712.1 hypothetical protein FOZ76_23295 [Verticiella sediminum]
MIKKSTVLTIGTLAFAATAVTGCESLTGQKEVGATPGICQRDAADALAGRDRLTDEQAKQASGASIVRQIAPGQAVTMDYRQERVTIETDPKTGKIVRAFCG